MKRITLVITLWAMFVGTVFAQKAGSEQQLAKEANELFTSGEFLKAYPLYSQLVSLYPQNADYSFRFGACAIYSDPDKTKAIQFLTSATKRNVSDPTAWYYLGKAYHLNYQFKDAVKAYESFLSKADAKVAAKFDTQREIETCIYGSNLLSNIKDVVVINKTEADKENFFRYMNLDGIGGKILTVPIELQTKLDQKSDSKGVIHYPGNSTTIYFASYGADGTTGKDIYKANILPDGKFSKAEKVRGGVNTKYDEDYCFLHSDGRTLYFASKGHNSMGGYDIFKSVMDPSSGSFGPAINLDFAINTPDDDIFYIADSLNQKAYFASGRTSDLNHLHVYNVLVQGVPLQIVYLKGEFVSEIDSEQKNATIQIRDDMSGRVVMENSSNSNSGLFTLYVPKGGDYKYYVKTENSPVIHEAKVKIPSFDKPVALRQELRLVNDNGQEKLVVNNFFDEILNEDISVLAAEMLRRKAGLEVTDGPLPDFENETKEKVEYLSVEKTMTNAPLAAGFGEGQSVQSILNDMKKDAEAINLFVAEADKKYSNAYSFALAKQKEAETLTNEAEGLKASLSGYMSDEDVKKLRRSQELLSQARELKIEAKGAIIAAENVKSFKESEAQRAAQLEINAEALEQGFAADNFDVVLEKLQEEKDRIVALRAGTGNPLGDLKQKATAKESALHAAEDKLLSQRKEEKDLTKEIKSIEEKIASTKKKSEKESLQSSLDALKSDLSAVQRKITGQNSTSNQLGLEARESLAAVQLFQRLSEDSKLGLSTDLLLSLDDAQRTAVAMKIDALESRFESLEINDDQTLALISNGELDESKTSSQSIEITSTLTEEKSKAELQEATANVEIKKDIPSLKSRNEATLAKLPANSTERKNADLMVTDFSIRTTESRIEELQKKRVVGITTSEKEELQNLIAFRNEMKQAAGSAPVEPTTIENARVVATRVNPEYISKLQDITNSEGSELERTVNKVEYQRETIAKLRAKQDDLVTQSFQTENNDELAANAAEYKVIEASILAIQNEINDVKIYKSAFDLENKEILETSSSREKLESQIALTQAYMNTLEALEADKQEALSLCTDLEESEKIRMNIGEIRKEYQVAETKLMNYESDLRLTADASEPESNDVVAIDSTRTSTNTLSTSSLEEIIENEESNNAENSVEENVSIPVQEMSFEEKAKADAEVMREIFKARVEAESVFAFEGDGYSDLKSRQSSIAEELKNEEKIAVVQSEILMIEAEIETESSSSKQRKLDKKAESLYFERARLEIVNAPVVAKMTSAEFESLVEEVDALNSENQEDLNSRTMLRDEVKRLYDNAMNLYDVGQGIRMKAGPVTDEIEKADYYRQAFAQEALAIEMLSQIVELHNNMDMFLGYSDQELTELRYGNPSNLRRENSDELAQVEEDLPVQVQEEIVATQNEEVETASTSVQEFDENGVAVVKTTTRSNQPVPTTNVVVTTELTAPTSAPSEAVTSAPAVSRSFADAGYYGDSEARDYFWKTPKELTKSLFVRTSSPVYSIAQPIPVNPTMPSGVYYCVQVGAFRNPIPQNLFDEFAPMIATTTPSGLTRYTAGLFLTFENADQVKLEIRRMGYSDAFVVAFRDGKRIPMYEAMAITEKDPMASLEREYVYGDGGETPSKSNTTSSNTTANSANTTNTSATSATSSAVVVNSDYYKGVPNAAPATQVETVSGLFFTVQIGVYSKPVPASSLKNISPLNSELTSTKKIRYTTGIYSSLQDAVDQRNIAKGLGIIDAFITAYYNGQRITLSEADNLIKEKGNTILVK